MFSYNSDSKRKMLERSQIKDGDIVAFGDSHGHGVAVMADGDTYYCAYNMSGRGSVSSDGVMPREVKLYAPTKDEMLIAIDHLCSIDSLGIEVFKTSSLVWEELASLKQKLKEQEEIHQHVIKRWMNEHKEEKARQKKSISSLLRRIDQLATEIEKREEVIQQLKDQLKEQQKKPSEDAFVNRLVKETKRLFKHDKRKADYIRQILYKLGRTDAEEELDLWIDERGMPLKTIDNIDEEETTVAGIPSIKHVEDARLDILNKLLALADKGDWASGVTADDVKQMLLTILGKGERPLHGNYLKLSEELWHLLENGRGDRVRVIWQNMVGYFADNHLLKQKSAPALNFDFFNDKEGADNINKGRQNQSAGFGSVLPLLDYFLPRR